MYEDKEVGLADSKGNDGRELAEGGDHGNGNLGNHDNIDGCIPDSEGGNNPSDGVSDVI